MSAHFVKNFVRYAAAVSPGRWATRRINVGDHYDNAGEISASSWSVALPDTADVNDFTVELYNGAANVAANGGAVGLRHDLGFDDFASSSSVNGITFYELQRSGIQNGMSTGWPGEGFRRGRRGGRERRDQAVSLL